MKVKILIEFDVRIPIDDFDDEDHVEGFTENVAKGAASQAAYDYLSLVKVSGYSTDCESVDVHVDGFGKCEVSLGEDHE